jgi:hypothetical protein
MNLDITWVGWAATHGHRNELLPTPGAPVRSLALALASASLLMASAPAASAQEIGVSLLWAQSENAELLEPGGVRGFVQWESQSSWLFRLSLQSLSQDSEKEGAVCTVYSPRIGCRAEHVETSASLGTFRLEVMRALRLGEWLRIGAGGGASISSLSATSLGESGNNADLNLPRTAQIGFVALLSADISPVRGIPLKLTGEISRHWVGFNACARLEDIYSPFCGLTAYREIAVGLAYSF